MLGSRSIMILVNVKNTIKFTQSIAPANTDNNQLDFLGVHKNACGLVGTNL